MVITYLYPLVNIQKAIENGHRNSGFSIENGDKLLWVCLKMGYTPNEIAI